MANRIDQLFLVMVLLWTGGAAAQEPPADSPPATVESRQPAESKATVLKTVETDLQHSLARIQPLLERYGYSAIFTAVLVEGIGIPAPGQTLLMAGAVAAAAGKFQLGAVLITVLSATVLGNSLGYFLGRWGGQALLSRVGLNERHLQKIESFYRRYGGNVVLFGRFVDGLRQLNGIVAGLLAMPWWTFTAFNVAGAALWTGFWGLGTYFLDKDFHAIAHSLEPFKPLAVGLSLVAFCGLLAYLLWRRRNSHIDSP
ncbi:MAG: DedA family protein [Candidatus Competibacteraceae bacterium]